MQVMRTMKAGMTEYQAESTFKHYSYFYGGARHTCYTSIAAAGSSGSIFHYGHAGAANDHPLRDGDMVSINYIKARLMVCLFAFFIYIQLGPGSV